MVGKGLMMFEDETIYEGNFAGMYTLPKLRSALPPTKKILQIIDYLFLL